MGEWKSLKIDSGSGWKEIYRESGAGWKALEWESAYEDFTTFTEVDVPEDNIQKTANHIDHFSHREYITYLYKDYGVDHFGDYTHKIKVKTNATNYGHGAFWMLSDNIADMYVHKLESYDCTMLFGYDVKIYLREIANGNNYSDYYSINANTWYYVKIVKSGTSLNAYIYSDAAYSILLDTLSLTLHTNYTFRYLYGCNTYADDSRFSCTDDIENFDLG